MKIDIQTKFYPKLTIGKCSNPGGRGEDGIQGGGEGGFRKKIQASQIPSKN